ncbi:peptidoglycan bridge formation glycyltransferase FemA/FemB family protein [Candidatus Uhrbacteria bacterium]|nr:peptidoglycan bridge formation glycyltransferase FemA/FemB family protein [Candidatus Uhrbacteria bacterium]
MDHTTWNQFVLEHGPRSGRFLQSWEWGEFQTAMGEQVRRDVFDDEGTVTGVAQWLERKLPGSGIYCYCPKGPIGVGQLQGGHKELFLRIEPATPSFLQGAKKSVDLSPTHTRITSLTDTEETLLAQMHSKTRYNIRVAQKHGVVVEFGSHDMDAVWNLFKQTSTRGEFRLHDKRYYQTMIDSLATGDCRAFLATASHAGDLLVANIMVDFGDTRTYLHGASSNQLRNYMGPYLLHWELIRDAKTRGLTYYDWWGVAPLEDSPPARGGARGGGSTHPWAGISRFKRGFPGVEYASPGTYDLVLQPFRYQLYQVGRSLIRIVRRYV